MQLKENADVLDSDNQKIGRIDRVVIDPISKEVTHLVVKKGLFFTQDKVVPVGRIETTTVDQVILKKGTANPDELPDFEETQHVPVENVESFRRYRPDYPRPLIWYYPGTIPWRGREYYPGYPRPAFTFKKPENTILLLNPKIP